MGRDEGIQPGRRLTNKSVSVAGDAFGGGELLQITP